MKYYPRHFTYDQQLAAEHRFQLQLMTEEELSLALGVPTQTLQDWHDAERGPVVISIAGNYFYRFQDLKEWVDNHERLSQAMGRPDEEPAGAMAPTPTPTYTKEAWEQLYRELNFYRRIAWSYDPNARPPGPVTEPPASADPNDDLQKQHSARAFPPTPPYRLRD